MRAMNPLGRFSSLDEETSESDLDWEESPCPLCGSESWSPLLEAAEASGEPGLRFLVVQCDHCSLCFTNPRPGPRSIGLFYPDDYKPFQHQRKERPERRRRWWHSFLCPGQGRDDVDRLLGKVEPGR